MAAFASALEGVLLHAVAALEAEDAGTSADAQTAYNSAWCALTCAVELHGGPDGTGLHELVRETCRALLDTYRLRYEVRGKPWASRRRTHGVTMLLRNYAPGWHTLVRAGSRRPR